MPPGNADTYEISACYRWVFGAPDGREGPERLRKCPDNPVIHLGPPPVVPAIPGGFPDRLEADLRLLNAADRESESAVARTVRSTYGEAADAALDVPGTHPDEILNSNDVLAGDDWLVTVDNAIGIAIGQDRECVLGRVTAHEVRVWHPPRIALERGEIGCSASWAARGGEL
ncbi:hypothetical protein F7O44_09560 [Phytoactinopolyspora sp. XMNu-373]|uniref:Uncharacterized protein n=2 Tax=Phytoactinopolyspora mesophila TaxID=2650750 RepID=A0A7K3M1Y3_9ACTN|nr:hypothetical protein [Phytoactinopolyspora mesophila]